jgi:hypothetical protein
MKKVTQKLQGILIISILALFIGSCDTLYPEYEVRVENLCEKNIEIMGESLPYMYFDLVEVNIGDKTFKDIKNGEMSDYQTVKSSEEYEISITYDEYVYDDDTFKWEYQGEKTKSLGTETWVANEKYDKFTIQIWIGDLIELYEPQYEVYGDE